MDTTPYTPALDPIPGNGSLGTAVAEPSPFSRALLSAMLSLRDGDFAVRLPSDLTGVDGKIADAFNQIAAVSERRARETSRVSRAVGKDEKLKQLSAVRGVVGRSADAVAVSILLIDDVVSPTSEVRPVGAV